MATQNLNAFYYNMISLFDFCGNKFMELDSYAHPASVKP
jgi:hypothetical protein